MWVAKEPKEAVFFYAPTEKRAAEKPKICGKQQRRTSTLATTI